MKNLLKNLLRTVFNKGFPLNRKNLISNVFKSQHKQRVLISYITIPFKSKSFVHTNYYEATTAARIFDELGYIVDVVNYENNISNLDKYDVIYGFGDVFQEYFESGTYGIKTIYYGTGMHVCHQNTATLKRVKDVYLNKGVWLAKSSRFVKNTWTHQTALVDGIIALGNDECAKTYRKHYDGEIYSLPAPFYRTMDAQDILSKRHPHANKSYLWFGSSGLVHKGLDLCLDYFKTRPDLELHICGINLLEVDFINVYKYELYELPNIHVHGFVDIESESFKEILSSCSYVILPSCSEGGCASVLTAIGNGALIPIVTRETSIATGNEILIEEFSVTGIGNAVARSEQLDLSTVIRLQKANLDYVLHEHNQTVYYQNLKSHITRILSEKS